jgi:large subunit ribosomal protein L5
MTRIEKFYKDVVLYDLAMKLPVKNLMELPKIEKIVVNIGFPNVAQDKKQVLAGLLALELITGQKAYLTKSSKQIHSFRIRKNMMVGACVTLRGQIMYSFLDRVISLVFNNIRHFSGFFTKHKENHRSFSFKIHELYVFPELEQEYHLFEKIESVDITIVLEDKRVLKQHKGLLLLILNTLRIPTISST